MTRSKIFVRELMQPPRGTLAVMQYCLPGQLVIDPSYQRSIETADSQALIADIALNWHWGQAQVLTVSRREGRLYVVDGQHRLAAAKLRGDIPQLPCLIEEFASVAEEAALFNHLNSNRRPVSATDKFRAALVAGDPECIAIGAALERAGLSLASHSNSTAWKPGQLWNIVAIRAAWKAQGPGATELALAVLAKGFAGQVLAYAGTIFPGVVGVCAAAYADVTIDDPAAGRLAAVLGSRSQEQWREACLREMAASGVGRVVAMTFTLRMAIAEGAAAPADGAAVAMPYLGAKSVPLVAGGGSAFGDGFEKRKAGAEFCAQCDKLVGPASARQCASAFCKLRDAAA